MRREFRLVSGLALSFAFFASIAWAQPEKQIPAGIANWAAPPYFSLPAGAVDSVDGRRLGTVGALGFDGGPVTPPMPFVGLFPCRVADTRTGQGFTGQAGPPTVLANTLRTFKITDPVPGAPAACGIPSTARAVSFQFTVTTMTSNGNLIAWGDGPTPTVSVLNWNAGSVAIGNGIVVPITMTGNLNVLINAPIGQAANLIIDVNGFYAPLKNTTPAEFLTYHASFQGTGASGVNATQTASDGMLTLETDTTANAFIEIVPQLGNGITYGLDRPGTYVSARARWNSSPIGGTHVFWVLGGGSSGGIPLNNGFGFRADGPNLKGVTIANGIAAVNDLAVTLVTGTFRDLLAVRTATSVEFFVDGVFKASLNTDLPIGSNSSYEVRLTNGTGGGNATMDVGFLTLGIPIF
jgi:hypothetical protein